MNNTRFIPVLRNQTELAETSVVNGQLLVTKDTGRLYVDAGGARIPVCDLVVVADYAALPLSPITNKIYLTENDGKIYYPRYVDGGLVWLSPSQLQSDWTQTDSSSADFIKNKPSVFEEWNRREVSAATTAANLDFLIVKSNCTITLPACSAGMRIQISNAGTADNVLVVPAAGNEIHISSDSTTEGIALNRKNVCIELYGTANGWDVSRLSGGLTNPASIAGRVITVGSNSIEVPEILTYNGEAVNTLNPGSNVSFSMIDGVLAISATRSGIVLIALDSVTEIPADNDVVYTYTLTGSEVISFAEPEAGHAPTFELWLRQPSEIVSFSFDTPIWWSDGNGRFSPYNPAPVLDEGNLVYRLVFQYDGENWLGSIPSVKEL